MILERKNISDSEIHVSQLICSTYLHRFTFTAFLKKKSIRLNFISNFVIFLNFFVYFQLAVMSKSVLPER